MRPHALLQQPEKATRQAFEPWSEFGSAHLVGACGSGMKALGDLLLELGWRVTGSDCHLETPVLQAMHRRGLRVHRGHHSRHLPQEADVVVHSSAVGPENPERQRAAQLGIPQMSYSQMLGYLMRNRVGLGIAGTHGKSSTSALTAWILHQAGLSPSAVFGAELCDGCRSGWAGDGDLFVVESCEFRRSFLAMEPTFAVILGIEPDHFDCFRDERELQDAFGEFAGRVCEDGLLLARADCPRSRAAAREAKAHLETFSCQPEADWWATDLRQTQWGTRFRVFYRAQYFSEILLPMPGRQNVLNALAAIALSHHCGASASAIREGLVEFPGLRRRFEYVGSWRGATLIDDYAHHPTAVAATLQTARHEFPGRRIWCAFQPHQVSRTQALMPEFARSFAGADRVLVGPVFAARETFDQNVVVPIPDKTARELSSRIDRQGPPAKFCTSLDQIIATLEDEVRPGDVVVTMGAGDINRVHHAFTRRLRRHCSP